MKKPAGTVLVSTWRVTRWVSGATATSENISMLVLPDHLKISTAEQVALEVTTQGI